MMRMLRVQFSWVSQHGQVRHHDNFHCHRKRNMYEMTHLNDNREREQKKDLICGGIM